MNILRSIWPTIGQGYSHYGPRGNVSYTKHGPGRRHRQGPGY